MRSSTPIIKDKQGKKVKESEACIAPITIRDNKQWILVRGHNMNKPLILFLHGGPGVTTMGYIRNLQKSLERHFLCVNWDQRGAGKSFNKKVFSDHLSINDFVEDICEMAKYLITKYNKQKIILAGRSWGSIIGSLAAKRYPHLFHAYIGIGQVVHMMEGEKISYDYTYNRARDDNNEEAIKELESVGFSPQDNFKYLLIQRKWLKYYGGVIRDSKLYKVIFDRFLKHSLEYTATDRKKLIKGNVESHKYLWGQMLEVNFIRDLTKFELPVYYCVGRYDFNTPSILVEDYFKLIQAPKKAMYWFEESAHGINFEEPRRFLDICRRIVKECV
jgi:pimeloyl-ACP methyl ester carboxylesterase